MKTIVSTSTDQLFATEHHLGVFGFCFSHAMMSGLQNSLPIFVEEAVLYLRVYFVGFPFLFMYNILSTMFTSIGESKIPLGLLIFSSILNIVMDLWMVAGLGLGVFGAAALHFDRIRHFGCVFTFDFLLPDCGGIRVSLPGLRDRSCARCFGLLYLRFFSSLPYPSV